MFKKLSLTTMILCMLCSSAIASLNAECSCKRRPAKSKTGTIKKNVVIMPEEKQATH
jgi:hypothetical protein